MQELPTPDAVKRITDVVDQHITDMLAMLNDLHTTYSDEEIVATLRHTGHGHEADLYEDWIADEMPPRRINEPDPEGPGGYVTDPPSESYAELEKQLNADRPTITYVWTERERMMYSCRATVYREPLEQWLGKHVDNIVTLEEIDAEDLIEYIESHPGATMEERRWPAETSETDAFELKVVQPNAAETDPVTRQAQAFQMLRESKAVPPTEAP